MGARRRRLTVTQLVTAALVACPCATAGSAQEPVPAEGQLAMRPDRGPAFFTVRSPGGLREDARGAAALRRRVSVDMHQVPLAQALKTLSAQTGVHFVYSQEQVTVGRVVSLAARDITLGAALAEVLLDAGVDVELLPSGQAALVKQTAVPAAAVGAIAGRVTDAKTQTALAGATVVVEGTRHSATTGDDGRYRIAEVAPGTYTARARYIGYAPGSASVTVSAEQEAAADFALEKSVQQLDEVVTTGTVIETQVKALPSPITVITENEIREKHVQRIDQLFRGDIPGVVSWDQGTSDDISRIFVRGGSDVLGTGAIKTYVDGVEVNNFSNLATIDPSSIERIELIRGPQASTIYGSEALDGVLQIFTKKGGSERQPVVQGRVAGGVIQTQYGGRDGAPTYLGNLSVSGGSGAFSYNAGAGRTYKGEWVSDYRDAQNSVYGALSGGQGWLAVELSGRLNWQDRGAAALPLFDRYLGLPGFPKPTRSELNYEDGAFGLTLRAQATSHWQHGVTVGVDRLVQESVDREPPLTTPADSFVNLYSSESAKLSFLYTTTLQGALSRSLAGSVTAGVNLTSSKGTYFSGSGVAPLNGTLTSASYVGRTLAANRGYFAQGQLAIVDALFLTAGLRLESNDNYGQSYGLAWSPRVGASYVRRLGGITVKGRASYGKSIRAPLAFERDGAAYSFATYLRNADIGPESQKGWDAGIELYAGDWASLQATYYDQTAGDLIDQVLLTPGLIPVYQYQNVGEIKNRGLELQGSLGLLRGLTLSGTYTIASSKIQRLSPDYTGDLRVGDQLLSVPKHTVGGTLRCDWGGWTANLGVFHTGAWTEVDYISLVDFYYGAAPYRGSGRDYWITYPSFTKVRLGVSRRIWSGLSAFVSADNLTNTYAVEQTNLQVTPGRTTTAGLEFRF
jgi:outer membrane receptor protein involved in Fe transport